MASWQEVCEEVPDAPFGRGKDEQALTEAFEHFVGGPERAFGLMRLYGRAKRTASGNRYRLHRKGPTVEEVFRQSALRNGYTDEQATAYLDVR
jgi:hypothetical protein